MNGELRKAAQTIGEMFMQLLIAPAAVKRAAELEQMRGMGEQCGFAAEQTEAILNAALGDSRMWGEAPLRAMERHLREAVREPHPALPAISPDCAYGKHRACHGDAWDAAADAVTDCTCHCHETTADVTTPQETR